MTMRELYGQIGGDYQDVVRRFGSEMITKRFVIKFLQDNSFEMLGNALHHCDIKGAFQATHTLKGVCLNLGFSSLYEVSAQLTEDLRGRVIEGSEASQAAVDREYQRTENAIRRWQNENRG